MRVPLNQTSNPDDNDDTFEAKPTFNIHEHSMRQEEFKNKEMNQVLKHDDSLYSKFNKMNMQSAFEVESNLSSQ